MFHYASTYDWKQKKFTFVILTKYVRECDARSHSWISTDIFHFIESELGAASHKNSSH